MKLLLPLATILIICTQSFGSLIYGDWVKIYDRTDARSPVTDVMVAPFPDESHKAVAVHNVRMPYAARIDYVNYTGRFTFPEDEPNRGWFDIIMSIVDLESTTQYVIRPYRIQTRTTLKNVTATLNFFDLSIYAEEGQDLSFMLEVIDQSPDFNGTFGVIPVLMVPFNYNYTWVDDPMRITHQDFALGVWGKPIIVPEPPILIIAAVVFVFALLLLRRPNRV